MRKHSRKPAPWILLTLGLFAGSLGAASPQLDQALEKYYAGYPAEAVTMLEPLALSGDIDAQYLLGNLLYTLGQAGQSELQGDPLKWYRLAAQQGSARAAYALGAIYNNRWLESHSDDDLNQALSYYRKAGELGDKQARVALDRLTARQKKGGQMTSLSYTNESFASKQQALAQNQQANQPKTQAATRPASQAPAQSTLAEVLSGLESSGNSGVDTRKLQELLDELTGAGSEVDYGEAMAMLRNMLGQFESTDQLFGYMQQLIGHLEDASTISTAPGAN